jgi:hypothetical protein
MAFSHSFSDVTATATDVSVLFLAGFLFSRKPIQLLQQRSPPICSIHRRAFFCPSTLLKHQKRDHNYVLSIFTMAAQGQLGWRHVSLGDSAIAIYDGSRLTEGGNRYKLVIFRKQLE